MKNTYKPESFESSIQKFWKENNYFKNQREGNEVFSMILPPPNVTGNLHLGHAWDSYFPDLLIRFKRLQGYDAIWFPGIDHAGIATQVKVEQRIKERLNKDSSKITKSFFLQKAWEWKDSYAKNIILQWGKLGIALDYSKLKFTLDSDVEKLVNKVFINYYKKGLIYQDIKLVNWDFKLKTAISNIEIDYITKKSELFFVKYKLVDSKKDLIVATTRPETILADVALFANSSDSRYKNLKNKFVINPLTSKEMPILFDSSIDKEYGSGLMKVTPGHSLFDYNLAKKHNLKIFSIFKENGETILDLPKKYQNFKIDKLKKTVIEDLEEKTAILKIEEIENSIPLSSRSKAIIEPIISKQWFLKTSKIAKKVLDFQKTTKKINFYPAKFEKDFLNWINQMEDWCISRQIWWGHRLPVWKKNNKLFVGNTPPDSSWKQSEDVLDTWFSSSLWPIIFASEQKNKSKIDKKYLSTSLFTGYDIILFWVSRMIMQSLELENKAPFKNVLIHGLLRDNQGRKMSKSLGNGINPIDVINKWGSDSLRMFLLGNSTPGNDLKYNETKVNRFWDLNNKLFNSWKLIKKMNQNYLDKSNFKYLENLSNLVLSDVDKFIINKIDNLINLINENVEKYNLTFVINEIENLIVNDFSSIYLEIIKRTKSNDQIVTTNIIFTRLLIVLHPFIPFLTEYIYQDISKEFHLKKSILLENYPKNSKIIFDNKIKILLDLIKTSRQIHSQTEFKYNIINLYLNNLSYKDIDFYNNYLNYFNSKLNIKNNLKEFNGVNVTLKSGAIYYIFENKNLINQNSLNKEAIKKYNFEYKRATNLLNNKKFLLNANKDLIIKEREKKKFYSKLLHILKNEN